MPSRVAEAHAREGIDDETQPVHAAQGVAPFVRLVAVHGVEQRARVIAQHRFHLAREFGGDPGRPFRDQTGVHQEVAAGLVEHRQRPA